MTYSEYANATSLHMADTMDCSVEKVWKLVKPLDPIKKWGKIIIKIYKIACLLLEQTIQS